MLCLASLTLVLGLELPVSGSSPGGHGPGAEVGVLAGLRGQLQTHGGDVALPDGDHVPDETHSTPAGGAIQTKKEADWCVCFSSLLLLLEGGDPPVTSRGQTTF